MSRPSRLQWSSGNARPSDWLNAGPEARPGIDICCDIVMDGLPLADESVDCVVSQHALQTLDVYYLLPALEELMRVLRPGGVLRIALPDLDLIVRALREGKRDELWCWDWNSLSGNCIAQLVNRGATRTPLNYEFLEELLLKTGFGDVRRAAFGRTFSSRPDIVALDSRPEESFFAEAVKPRASRTRAAAAPGRGTQIHLSWTEDPSTSLTIVWHTPLGKGAFFVEFRQVGSDRWRRQEATSGPSPGRGVLHRVTLTGLLPDTHYEYRVSADEGVLERLGEIFRTRTAPPPGPADFRFAFVCDTGLAGRPDGNASGTEHVLRELMAHRPLFVLGGGDYAYANRDGRFAAVHDAVDAWFDQMQPLFACSPLMAQYGNHEIHIKERYRDWAPRFAHPSGFEEGRSYSFDVGDAHFVGLFVPGPPPEASQVLWLDRDLAAARRRGMRWLIVYQHEPIFAHGHSHPARPDVRKLLGPIFEAHRVDLHLSGHDQSYERTYPLTGLPARPAVMCDSPDAYEAGAGVVYAKISPGGKMSEIRNDFSRFTTDRQPFIASRDDTAHHYAIVTVRATHEVQVDVYRLEGDGRAGAVFDSFRIKGRPQPEARAWDRAGSSEPEAR